MPSRSREGYKYAGMCWMQSRQNVDGWWVKEGCQVLTILLVVAMAELLGMYGLHSVPWGWLLPLEGFVLCPRVKENVTIPVNTSGMHEWFSLRSSSEGVTSWGGKKIYRNVLYTLFLKEKFLPDLGMVPTDKNPWIWASEKG